MNSNIKTKVLRLVFYWLTSFGAATSIYYLLLLILPGSVFGSCFRMLGYHKQHPVPFIAIPCLIYGCIATIFSDYFANKHFLVQLVQTGIIIVLVILLSSPLGGMLWHYYDMKAGYFPGNWRSIIILEGGTAGLTTGWLIVLLSIPYNIIGAIICFFITKTGARLWNVQ